MRGCLRYVLIGLGALGVLLVLLVVVALFVGEPELADVPDASAQSVAPTGTSIVQTEGEQSAPTAIDPPSPTSVPLPPDTPTATNPPPLMPTDTPVPTAVQPIESTANNAANLRSGPGTEYEVVGGVTAGDALTIVGRNQAGDWYQLDSGVWIAGFLVENPPADVAVAPTQTVVPTEAVVPTSLAPSATDTPASTADSDRGIVFDEPVIFQSGGMSTVVVLAHNTSDLVKTFTVKATFKHGEIIVATAAGAVNDMLAGQQRAAVLLASNPIPTDYDTVRIDVDTMVVESPSTSHGDASSQISFGPIAVQNNGGFVTADVEATNHDGTSHTFSVQAIWMQDGRLVGVGTGAVNDIAPGQTKTASLLVSGDASGVATVLVDTMVQ